MGHGHGQPMKAGSGEGGGGSVLEQYFHSECLLTQPQEIKKSRVVTKRGQGGHSLERVAGNEGGCTEVAGV